MQTPGNTASLPDPLACISDDGVSPCLLANFVASFLSGSAREKSNETAGQGRRDSRRVHILRVYRRTCRPRHLKHFKPTSQPLPPLRILSSRFCLAQSQPSLHVLRQSQLLKNPRNPVDVRQRREIFCWFK